MGFMIWLFVASATIPMLKLLPHFGINKYWAFACLIPAIGLPALIWWMGVKLQELERL